MKNFLASLMMLLLVFSGYAGNRKEHKKPMSNTAFTSQVTSLLGYPSDLMNNSNQSVVISYTIDDANIMHIKEIASDNDELKQYIMKRLNGKKVRAAVQSTANGTLKVDFVQPSSNSYFIQF